MSKVLVTCYILCTEILLNNFKLNKVENSRNKKNIVKIYINLQIYECYKLKTLIYPTNGSELNGNISKLLSNHFKQTNVTETISFIYLISTGVNVLVFII